jgi:hypothetical protein
MKAAVDREDIVWRFVKDSSTPRGFERFCFIVATVFIIIGAAICAWARVDRSTLILVRKPLPDDAERSANCRVAEARGSRATPFRAGGWTILVHSTEMECRSENFDSA